MFNNRDRLGVVLAAMAGGLIGMKLNPEASHALSIMSYAVAIGIGFGYMTLRNVFIAREVTHEQSQTINEARQN